MTFEQVLQKAVEGGYRDWTTNGEPIENWPEVAYMDPLFWQSFQRACKITYWVGSSEHDRNDIQILKEEEWKKLWRDFIEHRISNKDPEEFFSIFK